jgi:hypothetical protein
MSYKLDVWAPVIVPPEADPHISAIRISRSGGSAFSVVVRDSSGVFDFWLESEHDLIDYLGAVSIQWGADSD